MRPRQPGLGPKIPFIEFSSWRSDYTGVSGNTEVGLGFTGFTYVANRWDWSLSGRQYRGAPGLKKVSVEKWQMVHIDFQIWKRVLNVSLRLWRINKQPA